jgi:hypothetical protein
VKSEKFMAVFWKYLFHIIHVKKKFKGGKVL